MKADPFHIREYLGGIANLLATATGALAEVRSGKSGASTARDVVRFLDREARTARQFGRDMRLPAEDRKKLLAIAADCSRLKGEARALC